MGRTARERCRWLAAAGGLATTGLTGLSAVLSAAGDMTGAQAVLGAASLFGLATVFVMVVLILDSARSDRLTDS